MCADIQSHRLFGYRIESGRGDNRDLNSVNLGGLLSNLLNFPAMDSVGKYFNPNKRLKEEFVSNLTGSSMLEIVALSTIVPVLMLLPHTLRLPGIAGWTYEAAVLLLLSLLLSFKRSKQERPNSLRQSISSYRVAMMVVTCLCILAVDFNIFPRRYAKTETYGSSLMNLGVGSFVLANALVSREARNMATSNWKTAITSTSPLVILGIVRLVSTMG
ncbi:hypothetical protein QQ045_018971 [Rhodiola kirilowii]